jgi:hypothetical protein
MTTAAGAVTASSQWWNWQRNYWQNALLMIKLFKRSETGHRYTKAEESDIIYAAATIMAKRHLVGMENRLEMMGDLVYAEEQHHMRLVKDREREVQVNP